MIVVADDEQMIRVRLKPELKGKWGRVLDSHKITQQAAVVAFVDWLVAQDPLTRSMIFGQVPDADHAALARIVLKRLGKAKGKR
jgi:hypothetical protein